jgi:hypothetical protein
MIAFLFNGMHGNADVADPVESVDVDAPFYHIGTMGTGGPVRTHPDPGTGQPRRVRRV